MNLQAKINTMVHNSSDEQNFDVREIVHVSFEECFEKCLKM